jgi:hypothetical protein
VQGFNSGQVARWAFVIQNAFCATDVAGEEASEVASQDSLQLSFLKDLMR